MYLGIDLGTSNSAVYGNENGNLRLYKAIDGSDTLPSAILIDRRGSMHVGKKAYEQIAFLPENVVRGFKRLMGTSSVLKFGTSEKIMSPQEASAEIIRTLLSQIKMAVGDFEDQGAIVTIPAAFNQMQSEATMQAASIAGLTKVGLLQEPVAAALASIANSNEKNGQFLVYDLGGGTFDVAIVQSISGSVNVIAHAGINMLGGRDFDRAILNSIVLPWISSNFDLPKNFQFDPAFTRLLRISEYYIEQAKIELSAKESTRIYIDESQISTADVNAKEIYVDIELSRTEIEEIIFADIDRSVDLCRQLIVDSGYKNSDIGRIVFIGGPTRMPIVRTHVPSKLGILADLTTDPMTAVAQGAAIFAESRDWSGAISTAKNTRARSQIIGRDDINFDYPSRTSDSRIRVRVKVSNMLESGCRVQIDNAEGWTSGQIQVNTSLSIPDIPVPARGENRLRITVFDLDGAVLSQVSSEFVVVRVDASAAGIPATQTVSVKVVEGQTGAERNALHVLVAKGTLLPASGEQKFRSALDMRSGSSSHLEFELYQQPDGVLDPALCLNIGSFRIESSELERGDVIRRGDEIICKWQMDDNGLLHCSLALPAISREFNIGKYYVASAGHRNFDGEDGANLAAALLQEADADLKLFQEAIGATSDLESKRLAQRIDRQKEQLKAAWDADSRRSVAEEARLIRQEISRQASKSENLQRVYAARLRELKTSYDAVVRDEADPKLNSQIDRLWGHAESVLSRGTPEAMADVELSIQEAIALTRAELRKRPAFVIAMFRDIVGDRHFAIDKELHDKLANDGEAAIANGDIDAVRTTISRIYGNMFTVAAGSQADSFGSLMRW